MLNTQHKEHMGYKKSDHMLMGKHENKKQKPPLSQLMDAKTRQENSGVNPIIDLDTRRRPNANTETRWSSHVKAHFAISSLRLGRLWGEKKKKS